MVHQSVKIVRYHPSCGRFAAYLQKHCEKLLFSVVVKNHLQFSLCSLSYPGLLIPLSGTLFCKCVLCLFINVSALLVLDLDTQLKTIIVNIVLMNIKERCVFLCTGVCLYNEGWQCLRWLWGAVPQLGCNLSKCLLRSCQEGGGIFLRRHREKHLIPFCFFSTPKCGGEEPVQTGSLVPVERRWCEAEPPGPLLWSHG